MSEDQAASLNRPRHIVLNSHPTGDQSPIELNWGAVNGCSSRSTRPCASAGSYEYGTCRPYWTAPAMVWCQSYCFDGPIRTSCSSVFSGPDRRRDRRSPQHCCNACQVIAAGSGSRQAAEPSDGWAGTAWKRWDQCYQDCHWASLVSARCGRTI